MSLSPQDSLIQAVLDGDASATQRAELDRLMASDPALRTKFDSLRQVFAVLEAVPEMDPPASLVEDVMVRAAQREGAQAATHQRSSSKAVATAEKRLERPGRGNWFSALAHLLKEVGMNEQKAGILGTTKGRLLVTAGIAAVALIGLSSVIDFPPGGSSTSGTIVPVERYRAPQNSAQDINVGFPGAQTNSAGAGTAITTGTGVAGVSAVSPNAVSPNVVSPRVVSPSVVSPSVLNPNAMSPNAMSPNAMSPNAMSPNAMSPNAMSPNAMSPNAMSPNAMSPNAMSPNAMSPASKVQ
jgi:pentapeptide MXKDX repeat protein